MEKTLRSDSSCSALPDAVADAAGSGNTAESGAAAAAAAAAAVELALSKVEEVVLLGVAGGS
jgi:hypothetical protein